MSFVLSGGLNLTNSGPGLKIVEEPFWWKLLQRTSSESFGRDDKVEPAEGEGRSDVCSVSMFVTCLQLVSAACGMSCRAVKHYTQQPTANLADSQSYLVISLNVSDITLFCDETVQAWTRASLLLSSHPVLHLGPPAASTYSFKLLFVANVSKWQKCCCCCCWSLAEHMTH